MTSERGVLLLWDEPESGDTVTGYRIQRMVNDGGWSTIVSDTADEPGHVFNATHYNDQAELGTFVPAGTDEKRAYRVAAVSGTGLSDWSNVASYPADISHPPVTSVDASSGLMADKSADGMMVMLEWDAWCQLQYPLGCWRAEERRRHLYRHRLPLGAGRDERLPQLRRLRAGPRHLRVHRGSRLLRRQHDSGHGGLGQLDHAVRGSHPAVA